MARKPTQPALYELIRPSSQQRALPRPVVAPQPKSVAMDPAIVAPPAPIGPGRFVKIPVGYAYVAVALVLAVVVVAYIYGFSSGESAAAKRFEQLRIEELNAQTNLPDYDPMTAGKTPKSLRQEGAAGRGGEQALGPAGDGTPAGAQGADGTNGGATGAGEGLGPAPGGDPRQPGLNYFVLAHVAARNGEPMVDFCRKNGLDAHLVPDDNGELRLVIVCPGFAGGERQSAAVKSLESKIRSVGLKWKSAARGNRDFGDLYPKKHKAAS